MRTFSRKAVVASASDLPKMSAVHLNDTLRLMRRWVRCKLLIFLQRTQLAKVNFLG